MDDEDQKQLDQRSESKAAVPDSSSVQYNFSKQDLPDQYYGGKSFGSLKANMKRVGNKITGGGDVFINVPGLFEYYVKPKDSQLVKETKTAKPVDLILRYINMKYINANFPKWYILRAGTSTGKSTALMGALFLDAPQQSIICTQPKVVLCKERMYDIPVYQPYLIPGKNLGYQVGNNIQLIPKDFKHHLLFMTTEKLQQQLIECLNAKQFDENLKIIAIDEVHEISEQMIATLMVIKEFLKMFSSKPRCPIFIFMSATVNIDQLTKYLEVSPTYMDVCDLKRPETGIDKWKIDKYYFGQKSGATLEERFVKAFKFVCALYEKEKIYERISTDEDHILQKDILIFCAFTKPIKTILELIEQNPPNFPYDAFSLMAADAADEGLAKKMFNDEFHKPVKIILSTNMLEAGATISTLYCIIDTAIKLTPTIFPLSHETTVVQMPISQSSVEQRTGRVGRRGDGIACFLYDEKYKFNSYEPSPMIINQDVLRTFLNMMFLQMKDYKFFSLVYNPPTLHIQNYQLLQNISADLLNKGIYQLKALNYIDKDNRFTPFGIHCTMRKLSIIETLAMLCGANLYEQSIVCGIVNANVRQSATVQLLYKIFFADEHYLMQYVPEFQMKAVFFEIEKYYVGGCNEYKYDHDAKFDLDKFISIATQACVL